MASSSTLASGSVIRSTTAAYRPGFVRVTHPATTAAPEGLPGRLALTLPYVPVLAVGVVGVTIGSARGVFLRSPSANRCP